MEEADNRKTAALADRLTVFITHGEFASSLAPQTQISVSQFLGTHITQHIVKAISVNAALNSVGFTDGLPNIEDAVSFEGNRMRLLTAMGNIVQNQPQQNDYVIIQHAPIFIEGVESFIDNTLKVLQKAGELPDTDKAEAIRDLHHAKMECEAFKEVYTTFFAKEVKSAAAYTGDVSSEKPSTHIHTDDMELEEKPSLAALVAHFANTHAQSLDDPNNYYPVGKFLSSIPHNIELACGQFQQARNMPEAAAAQLPDEKSVTQFVNEMDAFCTAMYDVMTTRQATRHQRALIQGFPHLLDSYLDVLEKGNIASALLHSSNSLDMKHEKIAIESVKAHFRNCFGEYLKDPSVHTDHGYRH